MTRRTLIVALSAALSLASFSVVAARQQSYRADAPDGSAFMARSIANAAVQSGASRTDDRQLGQLLTRTKKSADRFRDSLDKALNRSPINGTREEDTINQSVEDFAEATDHLSDHFERKEVVTNDVEEVLRRGVNIDTFMQRNQLAMPAENDWRTVRRDLDALARAYNVTWDWNDPRYSTGDQDSGVYQRLTGTYQLDRSRGDNSTQAVQQAVRSLPGNQRQGASQRLMNRLNAPDTIAIDRTGRSVTIASSRGQRVTFEADGQTHEEQGARGSVSSRATLYGDQLVVTTTGSGNRANDFAVTFEPLDNGRSLRVTRRISDNTLREPVSVQSFYRKQSDEADWGVFSDARRTPRRASNAASVLGVPDGTRLAGTLDTALSTRDAQAEDRFAITVTSPAQYEGAVIDGTVTSVNPSGRISGRADMALSFEGIRLRGGRTYPFSGTLDGVRTADGDVIRVDSAGAVEGDSQTTRTAQRGAIGAGIGAVIGAITGGGDGAAIGAAIGAGGGAGTVIIQGRDQLDLPRGTELTITSGEV
jgi:hypothetical protein